LLYDIKFINFIQIKLEVRNIVATTDLGQKIDVNLLASVLPKVIYEPDQFPGAIIIRKKSDVLVCLVFASGKIVLVGLKSEQQIPICINNLTKSIKDFLI
jgi:transcription initiation factor TFIID TATA-box-binding protein